MRYALGVAVILAMAVVVYALNRSECQSIGGEYKRVTERAAIGGAIVVGDFMGWRCVLNEPGADVGRQDRGH